MYYDFREFKKHFTVVEKYHDGKTGLWIVEKQWYLLSQLEDFDKGLSVKPFRVLRIS